MIDFKDNLGYKICCARLEIKDNFRELKEVRLHNQQGRGHIRCPDKIA